ncbi:D-2-hydroxyacid dehydrogenase [Anaerocolumna sedimenticola]|uniref:D-2-hydroxyacid dehydrogenase n=1 Tax=Anaerocolumna sedimenticola TaxID=2696063 RepID=A0A6P1TEQ3_9FIRM|nr:D-2-hydroxyacid dehydrogenase [Anaerocolumna sedimenticola]QHQ59634.1 D-2-hydroxyacid dehydrogenase [Anaerocolumna sedimenticola]
MKIVVLDGYTENPGDISWDEMKKLGELTVYDRTPAELTQMRIGDAELVITNKTAITADILLHCPNVKYIGVLATGYNVIDIAAAKERNIPVCNIPTYGTTAVAQFVMALLLEICHHVAAHSASVKNGDWSACADFCYWNYPLMELAGKTMGIIGFGRIGQATAKLAAAFGMKILAYDEYPNETGKLYGTYVSLDQLYAESDVISLHCPLFPSTEGMINKKSIAKMKDGVILINTSRGPLIVEQDLADALNNKKVAYAACDVVSTEPIRPDNPLLGCYHSIITPHIAWAPKESRQRLMDIAVSNVKAFLCGAPENRVNF